MSFEVVPAVFFLVVCGNKTDKLLLDIFTDALISVFYMLFKRMIINNELGRM
jgi:uncharacterized membrane protein YjjB (DUF3815 family)